MQFSDIVASLKLAAQKARNNVNARRAGSINKQHLRGASLVDGGQFNPATIDLRGGLLVVGGMGTGKTNTAMAVAALLADKGESFVCYDKSGDYASHLYRGQGRDHILNQYDARGELYNVFADIETTTDLELFALAFFPVSAHPNSLPEFQRVSARELVKAIAGLTVTGEGTNEAFCTYLFDTPTEQLATLLAGTPAADLLTAVSGNDTLAVARVAMRGLRDLKSGDFSLRAALSKPDTRVFITSCEQYHAQMAPLNTFLLGRAIQLSAQVRTSRNPLPILADELGSLDNAPAGLVAAMGDRLVQLVACVQNLDQLTRKLGEAGAKDLRSNMRNTLVFRVRNHNEECETLSKSFGSREVVEEMATRVISADGSNDNSDSFVTVNCQRLVLPSEIQQLPDNTGYLKVAGSGQVTKVTVPYTPTEKIAEPFVLREDLWLELLSTFVPAFADMAKALEAPIALQAEEAAKGDAMAALKVAAAKTLQSDLANIQTIPRERASRLLAVMNPRKPFDAALTAGLTTYAMEAVDTFLGQTTGK